MRKTKKNKNNKKKQPTGWETVHLKKELLFKIYKEWLKLNKKKKDLIKKWTKDLNRHLTEEIQM